MNRTHYSGKAAHRDRTVHDIEVSIGVISVLLLSQIVNVLLDLVGVGCILL